MSRSIAAIAASIIGKLAPGWVLSLRDDLLDKLFDGPAAGLAVAEAEAAGLIEELDPRTTTVLLEDFERVLGPDHCGRDLTTLPIARRRQIAHQRWTAEGGSSIPYFIGVAAKLGETIEVEEFWPTYVGILQAGMNLIAHGEQFVWRIKLAPTEIYLFRAGSGRAGDPLGWLVRSDIECDLRRIAPEHTRLVFSYTL